MNPCYPCNPWLKHMKKRYWIAGATTLAIAGKLLLRPRDADWNKCRDVVFHSECSRFIDVDGIRVHYQEAGDEHAPALVLIHGFASSTLVWSKVFLKLAEAGYRVIAVGYVGLRLLRQTTKRRVHDCRSGQTLNAFARLYSVFRARSLSAVRTAAQWLRRARSIIRIELRS